ncbi:MAG: hypothetical protein CMJ40_10380 [Phycisphaerae bacterium]|nr:hypothetical protein [Phycisphaerae bacterium]
MKTTYRLGVDLGGTKIEAALLDSSGATVSTARAATPSGDYQGTLDAIRDLVLGIESDASLDPLPLGIGVPGSLSPTTGLMRNANSTCLNGKPLEKDLARVLDRDVRLANDANCLALSEATDGAASGASTVFGIILGTGVGGGLVADGSLVVGANAVAGEWGHIPLPWPGPQELPGPLCYCGRHGCLETFLSGTAVERQAREIGLDIRQATDMEHDPACTELLEQWLDRLARSLAIIVNVVDPDVVVVGGGLNRIQAIYDRVPLLLPKWVFSDAVSTRIVPAVHGDSSGVRGAARLW